jgi:hypothetical protein
MDTHRMTGALRRVIAALRDGAHAFRAQFAPRTASSDPAWGPQPVGGAYLFPGAGRPAGFM